MTSVTKSTWHLMRAAMLPPGGEGGNSALQVTACLLKDYIQRPTPTF